MVGEQEYLPEVCLLLQVAATSQEYRSRNDEITFDDRRALGSTALHSRWVVVSNSFPGFSLQCTCAAVCCVPVIVGVKERPCVI